MLRARRDECARDKWLVAGELIPPWWLVTWAAERSFFITFDGDEIRPPIFGVAIRAPESRFFPWS